MSRLGGADDPIVEVRSPAQSLRRRHRLMAAVAVLLIAEAAIFALAGAWWWPLLLVALIPIVLLGWSTLRGGVLDPVGLGRGIQGEERVAGILAGLEPEGYRALHEVDIGRGDADHVLVGPTGVFVIETKEWQGRFYPRGGHLMFNQRSADQVVTQVTAAAIAIRRRLRRAGIDVWVQAVIASTSASVYASPLRLGHVTALEADDLPAFVRRSRGTLDPGTASKVIDAVLSDAAA